MLNTTKLPNSDANSKAPRWKSAQCKSDALKEATIRFLAKQAQQNRAEYLLTLKTDRPAVAQEFAKHFGPFLDRLILGTNRAERLSESERAWFVLVPEEHGGGKHYHGFLRLTRVNGKRKVARNFARFGPAMISKFLSRTFAWKFGKKLEPRPDGTERRRDARIEVHLEALKDKRFKNMSAYILKRREAHLHVIEWLFRPQLRAMLK